MKQFKTDAEALEASISAINKETHDRLFHDQAFMGRTKAGKSTFFTKLSPMKI